MHILGIETSCDETAASIIAVENNIVTVKTNIISSQVELHAQWGGVVPNLAAREHTKNIIPVITQALTEAQTSKDDIDIIAVTNGPGLIPALLSGVSSAKTLAYTWHKPLMGIHHIEGHIYANWIEHAHDITFPVLALVVSGGHTQLVHMSDHCTYEIIGQTQDDAVGEAFDKVARILGLGYPGGPEVSKRAASYEKSGDKNPITLPRPMIDSGDFHFSFSGIKTAVLYCVKNFRQNHNLSEQDVLPQDFIDQVSHAFQEAVVEVLVTKTHQAAIQKNSTSIVLAGGVSANTQLRNALHSTTKTLPHTKFFVPSLPYCLDNAVMIATAAYYRYAILDTKQKLTLMKGWNTVHATARTQLMSI